MTDYLFILFVPASASASASAAPAPAAPAPASAASAPAPVASAPAASAPAPAPATPAPAPAAAPRTKKCGNRVRRSPRLRIWYLLARVRGSGSSGSRRCVVVQPRVCAWWQF